MRIQARRAWRSGMMAAMALMSGCAGRQVATLAEAPVAVASPPPRPIAPDGLPASAPARTADGGYATLNHGIDTAQAMWHVRAALNVAALGCRGVDEAGLIAGYNMLLARQKAPLARAYEKVRAGDRAQYGAKWESGHDAEMTRLYNYFAQPFGKAGFCAAAPGVMARATTVAPVEFEDFAVTALAELEAPFLDGYRRYDAYRQELAAWDARYGAGPAVGVQSAAIAAPVAIPAAGPRLAYAAIDTVIDWSPATTGTQRMASAR